MPFRFFKEIKLPGNGIFLSVLPDGRAFFRKDHLSISIRRGFLNEDWDLIPDEDWERPGWEDPRVFVSGGRSYCTNNFFNHSGYFDIDSGEETYLNLPGKNFTYLPGETLSFISWFNPLEIHRLDSGSPKRVLKRLRRSSRLPDSESWRGGTQGVPLGPGVHGGFGHRTINREGVLTHLPFFWKLDRSGWRWRLDTTLVQLPDQWPICDPTCILERQGRWYLITAQSPLPWFVEQPLRTVVYEFSWEELLDQRIHANGVPMVRFKRPF